MTALPRRKQRPDAADIVAITDRYRWMLGCRAGLAAAVAALFLCGDFAAGPAAAVTAAAWAALTLAATPLTRVSRASAITVYNVTLLGDGVLLELACFAYGGTTNPVQPLVLVHLLCCTLLISFRTGIKLAFWHTVMALVLRDMAVAGFVEHPVVPLSALLVSSSWLWAVTLLTAVLAAANERELRRRRYDSDVLRSLGSELMTQQAAGEIMRRLITFARDEMLCPQAVAIVYPRLPGDEADGWAVSVRADGPEERYALPAAGRPDQLISEAGEVPAARLLSRLDPRTDPVLAGLLGDFEDLVVIPFVLPEAAGVLAVARPATGRNPARKIERRVIATLQQAAQQAVTALQRDLLTEHIRRGAEIDQLTGVANRAKFDGALAAAAGVAAHGPVVGLLMLDLDHFKALNDTHGHQAGDSVLRAVGTILRSLAGGADCVARYGGEEFAVILHNRTAPEIVAFAERVRAAIAAAPTVIPVTASIGVAVVSGPGHHPEGMIGAADAALYGSKHGGRNRVTVAGEPVYAVA